jgi:dsDNA-binding SOS-regulon protein
MKTAVECLVHELGLDLTTEHQEEIEFFLEMEKEQMLNAFQESRLTHPMIGFKHETFVEYYKQFKQQEQ